MFGLSRHFRKQLEDNWHELYRVAYVWTHDRELASDLVQETVARCLKHSQKFKNDKDLRIWLFKVMSNCWRDHFRRQKNNVELDEISLSAKNNPEHDLYRSQLMQHVAMAFEQLKPDYREVLTLVILEGLRYEEVAQVMDIPIGTVMSRVSRARAKLKELLQHVSMQDIATMNLWRIK